MHRFSIRNQLMILSGSFIMTLAVFAAVAWMISDDLGKNISAKSDNISQLELLSDLYTGVAEAQLDVLRFAAGEEGQIENLRHNLALIDASVARAESVYVDTKIPEQALPELVGELQAVSERLSSVSGDVDRMDGLDRSMRNFVLGFEILVVLQSSREQLRDLKGEILGRVNAIEQAGQAAVARSVQIILAATVLAGVLAVVLGLLFGRLLSRPIGAIVRRVEGLALEDYATDIPMVTRGDEIGSAARAMEGLRDRLSTNEDEAARERQMVERRVALFTTLGQSMGHLADGDLSARIDEGAYSDLGTDYVKLCGDFNKLAVGIGDLVQQMDGSVNTVAQSAKDLSGMADDLSRRAETQAATLEETVAALEELSKSVNSAADRAGEADTQVNESRRRAEEGGAVMDRALKAMGSIAKSSDEITQIITAIDDIAFQTNLLALNAGVEAARAGEAGKGFSVVASEVRQLAQRASESAREIKELVTSSSKHVDDGERLVQETGVMLSEIVSSVKQVSESVADIAVSSKEQAIGLQEINSGMNDLDQVTQRNAAMVNETTSASAQLSKESQTLAGLLARFSKTGGGAAADAEVPAAELSAEKPVKTVVTQDSKAQGNWEMDEVKEPPKRIAAAGGADLWEDF